MNHSDVSDMYVFTPENDSNGNHSNPKAKLGATLATPKSTPSSSSRGPRIMGNRGTDSNITKSEHLQSATHDELRSAAIRISRFQQDIDQCTRELGRARVEVERLESRLADAIARQMAVFTGLQVGCKHESPDAEADREADCETASICRPPRRRPAPNYDASYHPVDDVLGDDGSQITSVSDSSSSDETELPAKSKKGRRQSVRKAVAKKYINQKLPKHPERRQLSHTRVPARSKAPAQSKTPARPETPAGRDKARPPIMPFMLDTQHKAKQESCIIRYDKQVSVKRERERSSDDDLYTIPERPANRRRTERAGPASPRREVVAPRKAPTERNEAIANSENPERKAYSHELTKTWKPIRFPDDYPPMLSTAFTRRFLSRYIGGCGQNVRCRVSAQKQAQNNHRIREYHCIDPAWDPHMPPHPGAHGVRYVIAHSAYDDSSEDETTNFGCFTVFCKLGVNKWGYFGEYTTTRRAFAPGEWEQVPPAIKQKWAEGFSGKTNKRWGINFMVRRGFLKRGETMEPEDVLRLIDGGFFSLEALIYECKGFNWELYKWLNEKWEANGLDIKQEKDYKDMSPL